MLYEEARHNVVTGRYPLESAQAVMLGGLQARIQLGPYDPHRHTARFFRYIYTYILTLNLERHSNRHNSSCLDSSYLKHNICPMIESRQSKLKSVAVTNVAIAPSYLTR